MGAKNSFQAGIRFEHTYANLDSETEKGIVHRKYGQWFPTLYWSHKINDNRRLNLSYNRRINRPSFNDLAPFVLFSDPYTFTSGNAALQPAIADAVKADYVFKQYIFSISYTHEAHSIGIFQPTVDTLYNREYQITRNIDYMRMLNLGVTLPLTITSWWSSFINLNVSHAEARTGHLGTPFTVQRIGMGINGAQTFRLKHDFSVEISGIYQTPGLFGASIIHPVNILNVAVQKKFRQSSLTLGVDDVFSGTRIRVMTDPPDKSFYADLHLQFAKRICKLTYTQHFGNTGLKGKRNRGTASDDVRGRI